MSAEARDASCNPATRRVPARAGLVAQTRRDRRLWIYLICRYFSAHYTFVVPWRLGHEAEDPRQIRQHKVTFYRHFKDTGATGLEPATSGVTGRFSSFRVDREFAEFSAKSRPFRPVSRGDRRVLAGAPGDLLRYLRGMRRCYIRQHRSTAGCLASGRHRTRRAEALLAIQIRWREPRAPEGPGHESAANRRDMTLMDRGYSVRGSS